MRIVIVGAGVAGSIMARSLSRLPGLEVTCLERVSRDDHSHSGTGLNIGPNAVDALRAHDAALTDAITAASFPWQNWKISLTDGTPLFDLPLAKVANGDGWRIRWSELYRVLRDATPNIQYNCTIESVGRSGDPSKSAITWIQDGKRQHLDNIDFLIATDGRYSKIRESITGKPAIRHFGVAISRLLVPDNSGGLIDDYEQWFNGPNRLLAFRVPPDHIYVACTFPIEPHQPIDERQKSSDALRKAYTPINGEPTAQTRWLIDTVCAHAGDMHWARLQEHDALYADSACNVLYLGDAAHGMVPTLGQGATQAIEDACAAAGLIARAVSKDNRQPRHWLKAIEQARRERMQFVMRFSLEATDTILAGANPVAGTLHKTKAEFLANLRRLYMKTAESPGDSAEIARPAGRLTA